MRLLSFLSLNALQYSYIHVSDNKPLPNCTPSLQQTLAGFEPSFTKNMINIYYCFIFLLISTSIT